MFHHLIIIVLTYSALIVQVMMVNNFEIYSIQPNFPLAVLLIACLGSKSRQALIWAGCIGFLIDSISRGELGVTMFCALLCTGILPANWFNQKNISLYKFTTRAFILCNLILFSTLLLKQTLSGTVELNLEFLISTFGTCCYSVFVAIIFRQFGKLIFLFLRKGAPRLINRDSAYI